MDTASTTHIFSALFGHLPRVPLEVNVPSVADRKKTFAALHQPLRLRINEKSLRTALQILD